METVDQLLHVFARSVLAKFAALKCLNLPSHQKLRLGKSITDDIRTFGGLVYPDMIAPEVSKAAQQEAERIGRNICNENWYSQTKFDPGRKIFQWEHVNTVSSIKKMCEQGESEEAILDILKTRLRIAWILKREDEELNRLGYRSNRPNSAYAEAKIELLKIGGSQRDMSETIPEGDTDERH